MPLHTDAEPIVFDGFVGFNHTVGAGCADSESSGEVTDGHVMSTIDANFSGAVDGIQAGPGDDFEHMAEVLFNRVPMMQSARDIFRNVLKQVATAENVHQLHAGTDRQNRQSSLNGQFCDTAVKVFAALGHDSDGGVRMQFHACGVQIQSASGEDDTADVVHHANEVIFIFQRGHQQWQSTGGCHAVVVTRIEPGQCGAVITFRTKVAGNSNEWLLLAHDQIPSRN